MSVSLLTLSTIFSTTSKVSETVIPKLVLWHGVCAINFHVAFFSVSYQTRTWDLVQSKEALYHRTNFGPVENNLFKGLRHQGVQVTFLKNKTELPTGLQR
uniref:Uncharacterized protein n=1 Tax=Cacopsylla melanoneura TaxID=428564 RepID=A0A8D8ULU7_9HEMI